MPNRGPNLADLRCMRCTLTALVASALIAMTAGCVSIAPPRRAVYRNPLQAHVAFDESPAHIPFKRTAGDLPVVLAETERGRLWMLVDTGCDAVVFAPRTAKRTWMQIRRINGTSIDAAGNSNQIDGVAAVECLSIGPTRFFGFYSVVNDLGNLTDKDHPPS